MRNDISWTVLRNFAGQPCSDPVLDLVQSRATAWGSSGLGGKAVLTGPEGSQGEGNGGENFEGDQQMKTQPLDLL